MAARAVQQRKEKKADGQTNVSLGVYNP